ncbi:MAG: nucleoid-associated protein, YbaB/EbfC family [Acidobacteria bacterium RIFCSPLOWO2_02_FULL_60_20]|nr:MAG: nucleoid-associated protein, YbaB/EbfC family [Acidobacteria bacterium RIFCSPLOWO2_02_FULL_60_20]
MRDLQQMMSQMKKMQEEMLQKMETIRVEASSGGGMVTVQMNGNKKLLKVKIDPEAWKDGDVEMLQDLVQAAVNEGLRKVDDSLKEMLGGLAGGLAGGLKIPGLF